MPWNRTSLRPDTLQKIMCLRYWLKLDIVEIEEQYSDATDLLPSAYNFLNQSTCEPLKELVEDLEFLTDVVVIESVE